MAENIRADALHILGRDVAAPIEEGMRARGKCKINRGAR
jgi:hypothetical protein